jgi:hypothetical protein
MHSSAVHPRRVRVRALVSAFALLATACHGQKPGPARPSPVVHEVEVRPIPLAGPAADRKAELSGMAWYGDTLILLPQYPQRIPGGGAGALLAIERDALLAFLDGRQPGPITPRPIPLRMDGLEEKLPGSQGFEAIAFSGGRVFLTVETRQGSAMKSYLVTGTVGPELSEVRLDTSKLAEVLPQTDVDNMGEETLVVAGEQVLSIYEANGKLLPSPPVAHAFGLDLTPRASLPFPRVEYRVTDASAPDAQGRFWAINYFYPGEADLRVGAEPLAAQYGRGPTHQACEHVERLLQFQLSEAGITLVNQPPLQLRLREDCKPRNWEALEVLEGKGFLLATDMHPETLLGFVPFP